MMAFDFSIVLRFKEALLYGLLTTLNLTLICIVLGGLTALFILIAPVVISLVTPGFAGDPALSGLTVAP